MAIYSSSRRPTTGRTTRRSRRSTTFSHAPAGLHSPRNLRVQSSTGLTKKEKLRRRKLKKRLDTRQSPFGSETQDREIMDFSAYSIQNKKIHNINILPYSTKIQKGLDILEQKGVMPAEQFDIPPNQIAERFLFGINCTLSSEGRNFSLLPAQSDREEIKNPNIFNELEFSALKPEYMKVPFCFVDECNPFYNLDDRSTRTERRVRDAAKQTTKPYLLRVASENVQINLRSKEKQRLKYFKDIRELQKRGNF